MREMDMIFTLSGMALSLKNADMYLPKIRCVISHLCNRPELRTNRAAAKRRNGVVGSSGRKMPIAPAMTQSIPKAARRYLICCLR